MKIIPCAALVVAVVVGTSTALAGHAGFYARKPLNSPGKVIASPVVDPNNSQYEVIYIAGDGTIIEQARHENVVDRFKFKIIAPQGQAFYMDNVAVGQRPLEHGIEEGSGTAQWLLWHW